MLLSVIVYNHTLTKGQWLGAAVVFSGISVEAFVKRKSAAFNLLLLELILICHCSCSPEASHRREGNGENQIFVILKAYLDFKRSAPMRRA